MYTQQVPLQTKKIILIVLLGFLLLPFFAGAVEAQNLFWVRQAGGPERDIGRIAVDASGNSYIAGSFRESATFGPGEANETILTSAGISDVFVTKYNSGGLLLWAKQAGGSETDEGSGVAADAFGNSYITGGFEGTATFGAGETNETTLASIGPVDIFVAKYNANGMLLWAKRAGDVDSNEHSGAIAVDASNNSYAVGFFFESVTFGAGEENETTLNSAGLADFYMAKYDADGLLLWAKAAGGLSFDFVASIVVDAFGNSYLTGEFLGAATFGAGETNETTLISAGLDDIFVAKYSADGLLLWAKQTGGSESDSGISIAVDASGNSYVTGEFTGSVTFGASEIHETTLSSAGSTDIFVAKYDADGLLLWVKSAGGSALDVGSGIVVNASGTSYVAGNFQGSATFGTGSANTLTTERIRGLFLVNYDTDGLLLRAKKAGDGNGSGVGGFSARIGLDTSDNIYMNGQFAGSMTLEGGETTETTLTSGGLSDIFVAKYGMGAPTSVNETSILINDFKLAQNYPNPFNPTTTISYELQETGLVRVSVYNMLGQKIKTLLDENQKSGNHRLQWDGTNNSGLKVTSGVYYYRIDAGDKRVVKSMLLIK